MATFALNIFFLLLSLALCSIGCYGFYRNKQGQSFPFSSDTCFKINIGGVVLMVMVIVKMSQ